MTLFWISPTCWGRELCTYFGSCSACSQTFRAQAGLIFQKNETDRKPCSKIFSLTTSSWHTGWLSAYIWQIPIRTWTEPQPQCQILKLCCKTILLFCYNSTLHIMKGLLSDMSSFQNSGCLTHTLSSPLSRRRSSVILLKGSSPLARESLLQMSPLVNEHLFQSSVWLNNQVVAS